MSHNLRVYNRYDYRMTQLLQEKTVGSVSLKKKVIPKGTILDIYDRNQGKISKGKYTFDYPIVMLSEGGTTWMTDTQLEIEAIGNPVELARGCVLIGGLGIGLLPIFIRDKKEVLTIDIVEISQDVIDTIFLQIASEKMKIVKDDIFHFLETTPNKYDFIHIDIWADTLVPIKEIDKARNIAYKCLKPNGIVWCWLQELYDRIKEELPKEPMWQTSEAGIHDPCLICGKTLRNDYAGLCMDCADGMGVSELFIGRQLKHH